MVSTNINLLTTDDNHRNDLTLTKDELTVLIDIVNQAFIDSDKTDRLAETSRYNCLYLSGLLRGFLPSDSINSAMPLFGGSLASLAASLSQGGN